MAVKATTQLDAAGFKKGIDEIEKEFAKLPLHAKDAGRDMLKLEDAYKDLGSQGAKSFARLNKEFKATGTSGSEAFNRIKKAEKAAVLEAKNLNRETGKFSSLASGLKGKLAAAFGAGAIVAATRNVINFGSALTDTAAAMDIGVEELQVLQEASTRAGAGNDILERGLRNVKGRVQEAADGNKRYSESIQRLGLNTEVLLGMPLERRMEAFGMAYQNATDKSAAFRDIQNIIGERAGPKLMEVLQRLARDGFDGVAISAEKTGQIMSKSMAESMDKAADSIESFKKRATIAFGKLITGEALFQLELQPDRRQAALVAKTIEAFNKKHAPVIKERSEAKKRELEDIEVQKQKEEGLLKIREQAVVLAEKQSIEAEKQAKLEEKKQASIDKQSAIEEKKLAAIEKQEKSAKIKLIEDQKRSLKDSIPDVTSNSLVQMGAQISGAMESPLIGIQQRQLDAIQKLEAKLDVIANNTGGINDKANNLSDGTLLA